jgi:hypothetical protein
VGQEAGVYGATDDIVPVPPPAPLSKAGVLGSSTKSPGIAGFSNGSFGVWGYSTWAPGIRGDSASNVGVAGASNDSDGVSGSSLNGYGVFGESDSSSGVVGTAGAAGPAVPNVPNIAGVVGSSDARFGVIGTSNATTGVVGFSNNSIGVVGQTNNPGSFAGFFVGNVHVTGNLTLTGTKSAAVPFPDGSHRLLYCMESPELWFEDFGAAKLKGGRAVVKLDADFAKVIKRDYRVFLTPEGDCRGLYVRRRRAASFEVRELMGGKSAIAFSYRIVGRRKDIKERRRFAKIDTRLHMPVPPPQTAPPARRPKMPRPTPAGCARLSLEWRKRRRCGCASADANAKGPPNRTGRASTGVTSANSKATLGYCSLRLAGEHDVVAVAEHEALGGAPDDALQIDHRAHPEPEFP